MFTGYLTNHKADIIILLSLVFIVGWLQVILLKPHLNYGFTPDDWWPLTFFKHLNSDFLTNILTVWKENGAYTSYQVFYISFLHNFFGFNFQSYQLTNHILKVLSAMAVYPLILVISKKRLLAFLTTILYAMAYSPIGTLELVVRGSDFIAIIFMCFFLIAYYYQLAGIIKGWIWSIIPTLLLLLGMFFSPIRIYPILVFILIVEFYFMFLKKSKIEVLNSIKRICFLFLPYLLMIVLSPSSTLSFSGNGAAIVSKIFAGNWQLLLYPLGSFGSTFLPNEYWRIFGTIQSDNFAGYVIYLLVNPLFIFTLITLFYAIILSIPPKRFFKFLLKVLSVNFLFQLFVYVLAKHANSIDSSVRMSYDSVELYPVFFAIFILVLSFSIWREWVNSKEKNKPLLALWLGPVFSFTFIFWTWVFKDWSVLFKGIHTYLNIPSIGTSLFIATTLYLLYLKIKGSFGSMRKQLAYLIFLLLIPIFIINNNTIQYYWKLSSYSMDAKEHEAIRDRFYNNLTNFDNTRPSLFYFDTSGDYQNGRFYEQSMLGRFSDWMYFKGSFPPGSCAVPVFIINHLELLRDMITVKEGKIGFYYHDYCKPFFYQIRDFYAFKLINKQPIDIKDEVLRQLGITP